MCHSFDVTGVGGRKTVDVAKSVLSVYVLWYYIAIPYLDRYLTRGTWWLMSRENLPV